MRGSDGDGWDFFMWGGGGGWWVQVTEWRSIVREGGGGDELVCQWPT